MVVKVVPGWAPGGPGGSDLEGSVLHKAGPLLPGLLAGHLKAPRYNLTSSAPALASQGRTRCAANHGHVIASGAELKGLAIIKAEGVGHDDVVVVVGRLRPGDHNLTAAAPPQGRAVTIIHKEKGPMRSPELLGQMMAKSAALVAPANVCNTQISCAAAPPIPSRSK